MRVLLIEDDKMIGAGVAQALRDAAYAVDWVQDGVFALEAVSNETYHIALLDLGLPKIDGRAVLRQIRARNERLPIIILTARDGIEDRVEGLDLGADDFLVKPFEIAELLARMRAVLRREGSGVASILTNGIMRLDPATHVATYCQRDAILTAREFSLLMALLSQPGRILSRSELEGHIYGWNEEVESNAIEFLIHAVRRKLGADAIKNVRGAGWLVDRPQ